MQRGLPGAGSGRLQETVHSPWPFWGAQAGAGPGAFLTPIFALLTYTPDPDPWEPYADTRAQPTSQKAPFSHLEESRVEGRGQGRSEGWGSRIPV